MWEQCANQSVPGSDCRGWYEQEQDIIFARYHKISYWQDYLSKTSYWQDMSRSKISHWQDYLAMISYWQDMSRSKISYWQDDLAKISNWQDYLSKISYWQDDLAKISNWQDYLSKILTRLSFQDITWTRYARTRYHIDKIWAGARCHICKMILLGYHLSKISCFQNMKWAR